MGMKVFLKVENQLEYHKVIVISFVHLLTKVVLIKKILMLWLKNSASHALFNFQPSMGMAGPVFGPHPSEF